MAISIEQMSKNELEKWEKERVGGKTIYVLRNSVVWSLLATVFITIGNIVYPYLFSSPYKPWFDIIGSGVFIFVMLFISCCIWLQVKWGRNETRFQQSLKNDL